MCRLHRIARQIIKGLRKLILLIVFATQLCVHLVQGKLCQCQLILQYIASLLDQAFTSSLFPHLGYPMVQHFFCFF